MRRKIKVKFTDFECNMLLSEGLPTEDVDELFIKIIDESEK